MQKFSKLKKIMLYFSTLAGGVGVDLEPSVEFSTLFIFFLYFEPYPGKVRVLWWICQSIKSLKVWV